MYKLTTALTHFRFNSSPNRGPINVCWYKLFEKDQVSEGVCLNPKELDQLSSYIANNKVNFQNQNRWRCESENNPICTSYDRFPISSTFPRVLILRNKPQTSKLSGATLPCMDIELLDSKGKLRHYYNLEFDIIGVIEK